MSPTGSASSAEKNSGQRKADQDNSGAGIRIGLLGGTFNPIHLGHLRVAEEVREALGLERVLFIPSSVPPHKQSDDHDPIAAAAQRLDWTLRATADHPRFAVDRIEVDRAGPSFLVDTLAQISEREAEGTRTVFIVGEDAFAEMGEWRAPEQLFAMSDFAVMTRPPGRLAHLADRIPERVRSDFEFTQDGTRAEHKKTGSRIELVPVTALDISSSTIRRALRTGRSIRYLVPESIRGEIEASGAYVPKSAQGSMGTAPEPGLEMK